MPKSPSGHRFWASAALVAAVLAVSAASPIQAQERKSLRWATSPVGSYGYQIAAQMTRIIEEALGGEYTITVQPSSPSIS